MDKERSLVIGALKSLRHELPSTWNRHIPSKLKDSNASIETRKRGNTKYLQKNHDAQAHKDIFILYCKSVALAPLKSEELALAYGNRSAFLLHIDEYEDCMKDIDKALIITNSNALKVKLLQRKIECLNHLGFCNEYQELLKIAQNLADNADGDKEKEIVKLINRLNTCQKNGSKQKQKDKEQAVIETKNLEDSVTIKTNKKYGRHLVAARDYQPGDIILAEKIVAASVNPDMTYMICHHCYKTCWSSISCNSCNLVMFCSESCRMEAWESYHNVECDLIPFLNAFNSVWKNFGICIRILIMAVKEAGGLAEFRAGLQAMDQWNDEQITEFFAKSNSAKDSMKSIYFLKCDSVSQFIQKAVSKALTIPLIGLVKHTDLIKNFDYGKTKDLSSNEDIVFLGSLLQKLAMIKIVNSYEFSDEHLVVCNESKSMGQCRQESCCIKGIGLLPLTSLINHSCVPNAGKCFTRDNKLIIYASQPIKKNSQIFITYICNFYNESVAYRSELLKQYNFKCKCIACKEFWPPLCQHELDNGLFQSQLEVKLSNECQSIFEALDRGETYFKKKDMKLLSEKITQALKSLKQPSLLACILDQAMCDIFSRMYLSPQLFFKECQF